MGEGRLSVVSKARMRIDLLLSLLFHLWDVQLSKWETISKDLGAMQTWVKCRVYRLPLRKAVPTLPRELHQCPGQIRGCAQGGGRGWASQVESSPDSHEEHGEESLASETPKSLLSLGSHSPLSLSPEVDTKSNIEDTGHTVGEP